MKNKIQDLRIFKRKLFDNIHKIYFLLVNSYYRGKISSREYHKCNRCIHVSSQSFYSTKESETLCYKCALKVMW